MEKNASYKIIEDTLENAFNKEQYLFFIKSLLNQIDESKVFQLGGTYIPEVFRQYVRSYERLGTYTDSEDKKIDILIVYLQKETSLERARTAQRNFVARYLKDRNQKDAGLVAFVSPNSEDWRFSLIKMEYKFTEGKSGKIKVKEEFTPARRWSFLVGANENSHTAKSRLAPILQEDETNPTLNILEECFNIEKVTKEFFEKYRGLFLQIKKNLDDTAEKDISIKKDFTAKGVDIVDFSKKLLGQIVFLYFLQKKGWFGVDKNKEWGTGSKRFIRDLFNKKVINYSNFFNDVLEPLFYDALARDRSDIDHYNELFKSKIPFLNGGLFDPINNYDWVNTDILLPNELFSNNKKTKEGDIGDGILDIFDCYNFTVKEDEPLEKEVAIDPEMLGKVFENLLEVKDRKSKGTYYTPREIVHYMCEQSLINYLANELKDTVSKEDAEKLIKHGESVIENESRVENEGKETDIYYYKLPESIRKNAKEIDAKLADIKVCDPAIGSGAFPVGMMSEIVKARTSLNAYLCENGKLTCRKRTPYDFKFECIQNSLYGVDIDPSAVEIAKLRLWLSLVVDEDDIKQIKPLPNLDYKIMQGNSLIEEFEGVKLFDEKLVTASSYDIENDIAVLKEKQSKLQSEYINLHSQNKLSSAKKTELDTELKKIKDQLKKISKPEKDVTDPGLFDKYSEAKKKSDELNRLHKEFFSSTQKKKKEEIKKRINQLEWELIEATLEEQGKVSEIKKLEEFKKANIRPFFLWKLHFADVFQAKGGFDVVIANPPYVDSERMTKEVPQLREQISKLYTTTRGNWDLYIPFWELGVKILSNLGTSVFITPNKWLSIKYGEELRKLLQPLVYKIGNCDYVKVFEAGNSPVIVFVGKNKTDNKIQIDIFEDNYSIGEPVTVSANMLFPINWGWLLSRNINIILKLSNKKKGSNYYHCESPFSVSEAYEVKKILVDINKIEKYNSSKYFIFINTGTIEKYFTLWGNHSTKYLKDNYSTPVIEKEKFKKLFPKRFSQTSSAKIIISGMRHFECVFDQKGTMIAGKSTVILKNDSNINSEVILGILNSKLITFYIKEAYGSLGIDGGIGFTPQIIESLPFPALEYFKPESINLNKTVSGLIKITEKKGFHSSIEKQNEVQNIEQQIDEMVYKLYELTNDDIQIIKSNG